MAIHPVSFTRTGLDKDLSLKLHEIDQAYVKLMQQYKELKESDFKDQAFIQESDGSKDILFTQHYLKKIQAIQAKAEKIFNEVSKIIQFLIEDPRFKIDLQSYKYLQFGAILQKEIHYEMNRQGQRILESFFEQQYPHLFLVPLKGESILQDAGPSSLLSKASDSSSTSLSIPSAPILTYTEISEIPSPLFLPPAASSKKRSLFSCFTKCFKP